MTDIHADMRDLSEGRRGSLIDARPWLTKAKAAVAGAMVLGAASISLARDSGPPTIDIEKLCRGNLDAMREVFAAGDLQGMDTCVADEQAAREQLFKGWATYPGSAKAACVQPQEYLPGYVEWQTCIEMTQAVLELRKRQEAAPTPPGPGPAGNPLVVLIPRALILRTTMVGHARERGGAPEDTLLNRSKRAIRIQQASSDRRQRRCPAEPTCQPCAVLSCR
jgi:hypothetical protein